MIAKSDLQYLNGADVYGPDGDKIGSAAQVYLDDRSGEPEWISVRTGTVGARESFVPLGQATLSGGRLEIPFGKDQVTGAPRTDGDESLSPVEEEALADYYGLGSGSGDEWTAAGRSTGGRDMSPTGAAAAGTEGASTRPGPLVAGHLAKPEGASRLRRYSVANQDTGDGEARTQLVDRTGGSAQDHGR